MKYFLLALRYLPFVLAGVQAVETSLPLAKGSDKKAVVLAAITAANAVAEQVPEDHIKLVSSLIDSVVGTLNTNGTFTSTPILKGK